MTVDEGNDRAARVRAYKLILQELIDRRPSGTRGRIAATLGRNRSFVSQMTSARYDTPIPAQHVSTILDVCHLSPAERAIFMAAYSAAHPGRIAQAGADLRLRPLVVYLPDLDDETRNRSVDKLVIDFIRGLGKLLE
ncbi:hypothetical protein [Flaviflagellibacter deserti]|uniref:XRE family transcriptional regulator n=1 Tax=Flaviflagellibacter deserti TaxID=2267266 RepID=A0ABV9Z081_9HYPH